MSGEARRRVIVGLWLGAATRPGAKRRSGFANEFAGRDTDPPVTVQPASGRPPIIYTRTPKSALIAASMSSTPAMHPHSTASTRVPWFPLTLLVCAMLALAGGLLHRQYLSLASALLLLVAWLPYVWRRHSVIAALVWMGLAVLLLVPALLGHAALALMALPVVFLSAASWLFARTLRRGEEPLIARFIRMIEGDARLELPGVRGYARGATMYWAALLAAMALLSLLIALCAQPGGWLAMLGVPAPFAMRGSLLAWYPEAGCWILLVAGFVGEYLFRRWRLRSIPHPGVRHFVTQIVRRWPTLLRGGDAPE